MAEKKIGANTYKTEPLPARDALKLWYRIAKAFGPAIERMPEIIRGYQAGKTGNADALNDANKAAVEALVSIMDRMDEDAMISLLESILNAAMVKRPSGFDKIEFDMDFRESLSEVFPVVVWVIQEQFSELFSGLRVSGRLATG